MCIINYYNNQANQHYIIIQNKQTFWQGMQLQSRSFVLTVDGRCILTSLKNKPLITILKEGIVYIRCACVLYKLCHLT